MIEMDVPEVEEKVIFPHILVVEGQLLLVVDGDTIDMLSQVDPRPRSLMLSSQGLF